MAKCRHCGKSGLFFRVNSDGLCKDCVRLAELEKEEKEKKARLEELTSQLTDKEELFHELKTRAEEEALKDVENKLEENKLTLEQQEQEIEQQKNTLEAVREEAQKNEKLIAGAANKVVKLRTLFKSIQYEIRKFEGDGEDGNLSPDVGLENEMDLLLQPTVELNLNCLNVRELRKRYKQNEKAIEDLLNSYEGRYTTKANATIYRLMVIALRAELQNILYNIKYGNLEKATDNVKTITEKYLKIATDGNQSIAPTMKKFIGQLEYMFIEAVKIEYEYYVQKERIKEEQKAIRDQMRQEAEERKLLEQERKKVEKEAAKYQNEIASLTEQLSGEELSEEKVNAIQARIAEISTQLNAIEEKKEEIAQLQNGRAGHVYVISNLGAFGDDVFKVGMTRRMEPLDRVNELGNASVPFPFDVHSMIFSDNAVGLESKLHDILNNNRVNKVNLRKEFFRISLNELEQHVYSLDPSAEFNRTMLAEQYRQSLSITDVGNVNSIVDDFSDDEDIDE